MKFRKAVLLSCTLKNFCCSLRVVYETFAVFKVVYRLLEYWKGWSSTTSSLSTTAVDTPYSFGQPIPKIPILWRKESHICLFYQGVGSQKRTVIQYAPKVAPLLLQGKHYLDANICFMFRFVSIYQNHNYIFASLESNILFILFCLSFLQGRCCYSCKLIKID